MRNLLLLLIAPLFANAHPGIGLVKDSKGNIYYTDLEKIWKISNGRKTVLIPDVHTHELYIDQHDNLYGENEKYLDQGTNRFDHSLWRYRPDGKLETIVSPRDAYENVDFSLARDKNGNEYYTKQFIKQPEWRHIYKKTPEGKETVFAYLKVKAGAWLHVQDDGSILFTASNHIYKATESDTARLIAKDIGNLNPTFSFMKGPVVYSVWSDGNKNIYAAVYSDQAIKKISPDGTVTEIYRSAQNWGPTHGLFDQEGQLWVLETSDKNEVRVVEAGKGAAIRASSSVSTASTQTTNTVSRTYFLTGMIASLGIIVLLVVLKMKKAD